MKRLGMLTFVLLSVVTTACRVTGSSPSGGTCAGPREATATAWVTPIEPTSAPNLPVTVKDFSGTDVTIASTDRILALDTYGTLGTTVYALGLGDSLVGRDVSTGVPDLAHLPVVTHNGHELNAEAILDLRPSVVLTDYSIGPYEVQMQLRAAGVPVVFMEDHRSRDSVGEQIRDVAEALGVAPDGDRLAKRVERDIVAAERHVGQLVDKRGSAAPRMVFLYLRGNAGVFYWFRKGSGADDLIGSLRGVDVAKESGLDGYRPLNAEGLVAADPDLFLLMKDGLSSVGGADGLLDVPGVAQTTAGADRCVVAMDDSQILSFGPQFPATLTALADAVYASGESS